MSEAVEMGDSAVALPPSKRRRRESFEAEADPPPETLSADNIVVDPVVKEEHGENADERPHSLDVKEESNVDSDRDLDPEKSHVSGVEMRQPGPESDDLPPVARALAQGTKRESEEFHTDHPAADESTDGDHIKLEDTPLRNEAHPDGAMREGPSTTRAETDEPFPAKSSPERPYDVNETPHGHLDDPAPATAYSPRQENGNSRSVGDYARENKSDIRGDPGNGARDDYDRDREYNPLNPNESGPSHVQGPQQQHGNSVLAPEVANVLNGLFERRFFEDRDIDGRAIDFLASVSPELALAALEDIQHRDFSTVRNKPAFIFSIFKRVVASGGAAAPSMVPQGGFPPATVPPSALAHLPPQVSDALQRVFASGVCHPSQFDDRAMDILVELHPMDAVRALSEFAAMEPGRVRNPSAFWMGLARKFKINAGNGGPPRGGGGGGGGFLGGGHMGGGMSGSGGGGGYSPSAGMDGGAGLGRQPPVGYSILDQRLEELIGMGVLRPDSLDDRAADALRKLPEQDALSVLGELPDPSRVRNMSAYVMGLCKKFATGEARSLVGRGPTGMYGGHPGGPGPAGMGGGGYGGDSRELHEALNRMDPDVRGRFYAMVDRGMFPEQAFDHRAIGALQSLNVREACAALDELAASDPRRIHNISAYFMGLARKFGRP